MKISELIETLQDLQTEVGDVEVRLAQQPSWPFEYSIGPIVATDPRDNDDDEDDEDRDIEPDDAASVVYIGEGRQLAYLDTAGANALGWGRR